MANISSINQLTRNANVSRDELIENVKGKFNVGEIVFKNGKFGKVNNFVGGRAGRNTVVTTEAQNRTTNAAVFKALLQKYGSLNATNDLRNNANANEFMSVEAILSSNNETAIKNALNTHHNPYLLEAYEFLLCDGNDGNPLSRDELRLLDTLLQLGHALSAKTEEERAKYVPADYKDENNPQAVVNNYDVMHDFRNNVQLLKDLRAIKSGAKEINLANVVDKHGGLLDDDTKAEWWVAGLRVKNASADEQRRVIAPTVNKLAAQANNSQQGASKAEMALFNHMPKLVHECEKLAARRWVGKDESLDVQRNDLDKFLNMMCGGRLESKLLASLMDYNAKGHPCGEVSTAELRTAMAQLIARTMLRLQPSLRLALAGDNGAKLLGALLFRVDPRQNQFVPTLPPKGGRGSESPLDQQIQFKLDILFELYNSTASSDVSDEEKNVLKGIASGTVYSDNDVKPPLSRAESEDFSFERVPQGKPNKANELNNNNIININNINNSEEHEEEKTPADKFADRFYETMQVGNSYYPLAHSSQKEQVKKIYKDFYNKIHGLSRGSSTWLKFDTFKEGFVREMLELGIEMLRREKRNLNYLKSKRGRDSTEEITRDFTMGCYYQFHCLAKVLNKHWSVFPDELTDDGKKKNVDKAENLWYWQNDYTEDDEGDKKDENEKGYPIDWETAIPVNDIEFEDDEIKIKNDDDEIKIKNDDDDSMNLGNVDIEDENYNGDFIDESIGDIMGEKNN